MTWTTGLVIGGVPYARTDRIGARVHLDSLRRDLRGGYDELAFSVHGGAATQAWHHGVAVSATVDLGAGPVVKFVGEITDVSWGVGPHGWVQAYTCQGLKFQSDRVPVTGVDLTGNYILNRSPDDPYYAAADAALTIGQIFTRVLTITSTATALSAIGIQYATLTPPTLHATTVSDFALLTIVPPSPVQLAGECIFNTLDQILSRWMPPFVLEVPPSGIIRAKDTTSTSVFVPRTLTLPGTSGTGTAGVQWPRIRASTARCAGRVILRGGPIVGVALLSKVDGTVAPAWSGTDQTAWNLYSYTQPGTAKSTGTITSITGNTATVTSASSTETWASNHWQGAYVCLTNTVATGLAMTEFRTITTNTALTAGGSSTFTWDAAQPLDNTGYSSYRLVTDKGPIVDVGRLYNVREPASGNLGTNTYIGSHLVVRSPLPIKWANNTTSVEINYPTALILGGTVQSETPIAVEVLPASGQFRLRQPDVTVYGSAADLQANGYPTTVAKGLPVDVQILALYSRGVLEAIVPADIAGVPQYQGTAFTAMGLAITKTIDVPAYIDQWSQASMIALATQHLLAIQDVVYEGTGEYYGEPSWDVLDFNYALNYAIAGTTSPWSAINAPVRGVSVTWPQAQGMQHLVAFDFSTQRRPFAGDDLYLHPSFTGQSMLGGFQGGLLGGYTGGGIATRASYGGGAEGLDASDFLHEGPIGRPATPEEKERHERTAEAQRERKEEAAAARQAKKDAVRARHQKALQEREDREARRQQEEASEGLTDMGFGPKEGTAPIKMPGIFEDLDEGSPAINPDK